MATVQRMTGDEAAATSASLRPVKVWDVPTRLFHWALVGLIVASWATAEFGSIGKFWHFMSGYALLALILFRLAWGVIGSRHARFADFLYAPGRIARYAASVFKRAPSYYAGHNPLGGVSVLALLLLIGVQATSGLFTSDDFFAEGPLADTVSSAWRDTLSGWHHLLFDALVALIAVHVAAIAFYRLWKGEDLLGAMVNGRKNLPHNDGGPVRERPVLALGLLALTGAMIAVLVRLN